VVHGTEKRQAKNLWRRQWGSVTETDTKHFLTLKPYCIGFETLEVSWKLVMGSLPNEFASRREPGESKARGG
jgi:hypothetical protein